MAIAHTISYAIVSRRSAQSQAVIDLVALPPEQHHLVTDLDRVVVAAVDHQLVHRDGADDRTAATPDQHLAADEAEPSRDAVVVADRHGGDDG